jgi:DNA repair protein RadC
MALVKRPTGSKLSDAMEDVRQLWAQNLKKIGPLQNPDDLRGLFWVCLALANEPGLAVVVLDRHNRYEAHECLAIDHPERLEEYAEALLDIVLDAKRRGERVVVAHNLIGDKQQPDAEDVVLKLHLQDTVGPLGMKVWQHYIYGPAGIQRMPAPAAVRIPKEVPVPLYLVPTVTSEVEMEAVSAAPTAA